MARLTIEQVQAPDLNQASQILARAGQSFNDGIESAKGLLGKYQEGQMARADASILNDIAKLGSEEELNAYLNSDALVGKNFSPAMQETILGLRKGVLGYESDRQSTTNARDSNSRANAVEGRAAAEYSDGVAARNEVRSLTGDVVRAAVEGRATGTNFDWSKVAIGGAAARPDSFSGLQPEYAERVANLVTAAEAELGEGSLKITSAYRDPNTQADIVAQNMSKYGLGSRVDQWRADVESMGAEAAGAKWRPIMREAGLTKFVAMPGGSDHQKGLAVDFADASGSLIRDPNSREAKWIAENAGRFGLNIPMSWEPWQVGLAEGGGGESGPITRNNVGGPAQNALVQSILASTKLAPDEALKLLETGYAAQTEGQALLDAANKKRTDEIVAGATIDAIQSPDNLTSDAVRTDLLNTPGVSAAARLSAAQQNLDPLSGVITPTVRPQGEVNAALERAALTDANSQSADPQVQAFVLADRFSESSDLGSSLLETANLSGDALEESGLDAKYVNQQIKTFANKAGVTEAQAAAALAQLDAEGYDLDKLLIGGRRGSVSSDEVVQQIQSRFGPEAVARYNEVQANTSKTTAEREAAKLQLDTIRASAAKLDNNDPRKAALTAQADRLAQTIVAGATPQQVQQTLEDYVVKTGMASRLQGLEPNSPEFFRAMSQLEEAIKTDSSLTNPEKDLLIQALRG